VDKHLTRTAERTCGFLCSLRSYRAVDDGSTVGVVRSMFPRPVQRAQPCRILCQRHNAICNTRQRNKQCCRRAPVAEKKSQGSREFCRLNPEGPRIEVRKADDGVGFFPVLSFLQAAYSATLLRVNICRKSLNLAARGGVAPTPVEGQKFRKQGVINCSTGLTLQSTRTYVTYKHRLNICDIWSRI